MTNEMAQAMRSETTLKSRILRLTALTLILAGFASFGAMIVYRQLRSGVSQKATAETLERTARAQIEALVPTFLLPEQSQGSALLLSHVKSEEGLEDIRIIGKGGSLPTEFSDCKLTRVVAHCVSHTGTEVGVVVPIVEVDQDFGYLFKTKRVENAIAGDQFQLVAELVAVALLGVFIVLLIGTTRITAIQVPQALDQLAAWIETVVDKSDSAPAPNLAFKEFNSLGGKIAQIIADRQKVRDQAQFGALAEQVAHDVRSPLVALQMIAATESGIPEEKRILLQSAVARIRDITNHLQTKSKVAPLESVESKSSLSTELVFSLLESIISEKRIQYSGQSGIQINTTLDLKSYGLFAKVNAVEFKRVLSNLINNGVEALQEDGSVNITLFSTGPNITLKLEDNGNGIPSEVLPRLMQRGASFGKINGSGLGLFHARSSIESCGGKLSIESEVGQGTTLTIQLPMAEAPSWFSSELRLEKNSLVLILDDDPTIHGTWDTRFSEILTPNSGIKLLHFNLATNFEAWLSEAPPGVRFICLMDYGLISGGATGLDIIEKFELGDRAVLVTSRYEEERIRERCEKAGVRMIPKVLTAFVPILLEAQDELSDFQGLVKSQRKALTWKPNAVN